MGEILVPVDGSDHAERALEYAIEHFPEQDLTAFHVVEAPKGYFAATAADIDETPQVKQGREKAEDLLDELETQAAEKGAVVDTAYEVGDPVDEILSYAAKEGVDEIVIGSRGISGVGRVVFGSTAETVVRRAEIPVVVVH
ncbi:MAG: universal stress protein [Halodesulfurarchaeum sp.]